MIVTLSTFSHICGPPVGPLWEMSLQDLWLFFSRIVWSWVLSFMCSSYIFWILPLVDHVICKYLLLCSRLLLGFDFTILYSEVQKLLSLMCSHWFIFAFVVFAQEDTSREPCQRVYRCQCKKHSETELLTSGREKERLGRGRKQNGGRTDGPVLSLVPEQTEGAFESRSESISWQAKG